MAKDLKFNKTMSVKSFKEDQGIDNIKVASLTEGHFCMIASVDGVDCGVIGAAMNPADLKNPVISEVTGNDGATFFLLHSQYEVEAMMTL